MEERRGRPARIKPPEPLVPPGENTVPHDAPTLPIKRVEPNEGTNSAKVLSYLRMLKKSGRFAPTASIARATGLSVPAVAGGVLDLRRRCGWKIETASLLRDAGKDVPPTASGYRLAKKG